MGEPKDSWRHGRAIDPLAIAMMRTEEMKSKEQQTSTSERLNPHLTRSMGIKKKRGRRKESALF
jgi:hypothetical protein